MERKIKVAGLREIASFSRDASNAVDLVRKTARSNRTRNIRFRVIDDENWRLYLDEGARYTFFFHGESRGVRMQSMDSLHSGGGAASHAVAQRIQVPPGTWIVEFKLFLGKPFIDLYHVAVGGLPTPELTA